MNIAAMVSKRILLGCLLLASLITVLFSSQAFAAVPQDTYGWSRNFAATTPQGIAISGDRIYMPNQNDDRVDIYKTDGTFISSFGGTWSDDDGQFRNPTFVAIDASGNVYVADKGNCRIEKFDASGAYLSKFGTCDAVPGHLEWPMGIAIEPSGDILVVDSYNAKVLKFAADGTYLSEFGASDLNEPAGIAIGPDSSIFVVDQWGQKIVKYDSGGTRISSFASDGSGAGQVSYPSGIAIDANGDLLVVDDNNNRVDKFDANGNYLSSFGAPGSSDEQFNFASPSPAGIAVDAAGNVYVADLGNNRISVWKAETPPSVAPQNPAATTTSSTAIHVSWEAPTLTGVNPLTSYRIRYAVHGTSSWVSQTTDSSTLSIDLTGLNPDTQYDIQVFAVNAYGDSPVASMTVTTGAVSIDSSNPTASTNNSSPSLAATGADLWIAAVIGALLVAGGLTVLYRLRSARR